MNSRISIARLRRVVGWAVLLSIMSSLSSVENVAKAKAEAATDSTTAQATSRYTDPQFGFVASFPSNWHAKGGQVVDPFTYVWEVRFVAPTPDYEALAVSVSPLGDPHLSSEDIAASVVNRLGMSFADLRSKGSVAQLQVGGHPATQIRFPGDRPGVISTYAAVDGFRYTIASALSQDNAQFNVVYRDFVAQFRFGSAHPSIKTQARDALGQLAVADTFQKPIGGTLFAGFDVHPSVKYGVWSACLQAYWQDLWHSGEDWGNPGGTSVTAVANGQVSWYDSNDSTYPGRVVILSHTLPDGSTVYSVYSHLGTVAVYQGETVSKNDRIGTVLDQASNSHLHWEMRFFRDGSGLCNSGPSVMAGPGYTYPDHPQSKGYTAPSDYVARHQGNVCPGGDVNGDCQVDIVDIGILIDYYGEQSCPWHCDLNEDGVINIIDIGIVIDNYGRGTGAVSTSMPSSLQAVPSRAGNAVAPALDAATPPALTGGWITTGPMGGSRRSQAVTLLPDGIVLAVGGSAGDTASAELYDPATDQWQATGSMNASRDAGFTATLLATGKVLVVGGSDTPGHALDSTELYDPAAGTWEYTGSLASPRYGHTATLLNDGRVLVVGGCGSLGAGCLTSAELYDPATGLWTSAGSMSTSRLFHTATLLSNGKVLVVGGYGETGTLSSSELYDPRTGKWTKTGILKTSRASHTATRLQNGRVLVAGGFGAARGFVSNVELYDPATGTWAATRPLHIGRENHTATLLSTGKVLVAGGWNGDAGGSVSSAELYDPATATWTPTAPMDAARSKHGAVLLRNRRVLVVGGESAEGVLASTELYVPPIPSLIAPIAADTLFGLRPGFDWTDVNGATKYYIQISRNAAFTDLVVNTTVIPSSFAPSADLPANRYLFWRARAQVAGIWQGWSSSERIQMPNPPSVPTLVTPANGVLIMTYQPRLDWSNSFVPVSTSFDHYRLQLAADPGFTSVVLERNITGGSAFSAYMLLPEESLAPNARYYWRVQAYNTVSQYSSWSRTASFRTVIASPTLVSPANSLILDSRRPPLDWTDVDGATQYRLQVSRSPIFSSVMVDVLPVQSSFTAGLDLPAGAVLYWRVRARGPNGPSGWSEVWQFTTP